MENWTFWHKKGLYTWEILIISALGYSLGFTLDGYATNHFSSFRRCGTGT
jgi:hypothetical protein